MKRIYSNGTPTLKTNLVDNGSWGQLVNPKEPNINICNCGATNHFENKVCFGCGIEL